MLSTLDSVVKTCTLARLAIARFREKSEMSDGEVDNFLEQLSTTLQDIEDKVDKVQEEIKR